MWLTSNSVPGNVVYKETNNSTGRYQEDLCQLYTHRNIVTKEGFSVMTATIILNDSSIIICHISLHLPCFHS